MKKISVSYLAIFTITLALTILRTESLAVMSVDLGSEFMKIAIVKPGVPMEIVLNKESRRKTPLAVSIKNNDREFGELAMQRAVKTPKAAYLYLTQLLAKSLDSPAVKAYQERYPYHEIREDAETKTIYFQHDDETRYTPEELLAMILDYARDLAADFSEQAIDAAVLTVPAYFSQAERKAVLRAAEIANLKVLQLINSNVAAGLNYGVFRRKDFNSTGTTLMFFDMGGSGTTATVATFQMVKLKDDYEANPQLTVRGVGFNREVGGQAFTLRLAKHLAHIFLKQTKKDVFSSPKAIIKLYKEAERVKNILSANVDTMAQVEGLMDEVDFKAKVSREEFESMSKDLFESIDGVVQDALKSAEISLDEIGQVILVGASTRIPRVQDELLKSVKKSELGKNLNTDEAPALGAVYQAAFQSKGYKVKKFYIKDMNLYPLTVDFERFHTSGEEEQSTTSGSNSVIRRILFDKYNTYPQRKVMTFSRHVNDFGFNINYGDLSHLQVGSIGSLNISQVGLVGVSQVFEKHQGEETKGIKVHFKLDDSGVLRVDKIDITFEKNNTEAQENDGQESTLSKLGNKISSFFGSNGKEDPSNPTNEDEKPEKQEDTNSESTTNQESKTTLNQTNATTPDSLNQTTTSTTPTQNLTILREDIKFEQVDLDLRQSTREQMDSCRAKLSTLKEKEKEKRKRSAAINSLETFIFDTKDKLGQEEFIKCSSESERELISSKLDEADMWLSDSDDSTETKMFNEKLSELKSTTKGVFYRLKEKKQRPVKFEELREVLNKSTEFLANSRNLTGEDLPLTEAYWVALEKLVNSTKEWLVGALNEQAKVKDSEDPKVLSAEIVEKSEALKKEVNYLVSKIKYFRPKTTKKPKTEKSTAEKTAAEPESETKKEGEDYFSEENTTENQNEESNREGEEKTTTTTGEDDGTTKNPEL